ncbi:MAG: thioredoxin domain-containing protein [Sulfurovaceae bacterium]|nr:thioredoxin domain-containing protein [Sulfurovaceae bacterium]
MRKLLVMMLLTMTAMVTIACSAKESVDEKAILKFVKNQVVKNKDVKVLGITVIERKNVKELPGWEVLLVTLQLEYNNQKLNAPETFFVRDNVITPVLVDLKTGVNYRDEIKPTVPNEVYDANHLLSGNANAKHKILVFSDPLCPFCQEIVPELLAAANANPDLMAVYYYHLPLKQIHPASDVLTRIMEVAQRQGKNDIIAKIYTLQIDPNDTNETKLINTVKDQTGFIVTPAQINLPEIINALTNDEQVASKLMVTGTPTIYIDGKLDKLREGFRDLLPKK